jgi:hypothetical protein
MGQTGFWGKEVRKEGLVEEAGHDNMGPEMTTWPKLIEDVLAQEIEVSPISATMN